jgi:C_GCAxxG_C_C family probable redox protein
MNKAEKTVDLHMNGGLNCAQAIIAVYGEPSGLDLKTAKLLGRPFGGGIGALGKTCGYLIGAILCLAHSRNNKDEGKARKNTKKAVQEMFRRFEEKHGTSMCKELLGADMSTVEGAKKIEEENLVAKRCYGYGRDVAEILSEFL